MDIIENIKKNIECLVKDKSKGKTLIKKKYVKGDTKYVKGDT